MVEQSPTIEFEDVPLDEARRLSREPLLYDTLCQKIQSLSSEEDLQQAQETASRLQAAQRQGRTHRGRRKRPS